MTEVRLTPSQADMLVTKLYIQYLKYDGPVFQRREEEENETS